MIDVPRSEPGAGSDPSEVSWPAGPHYFDLTGSEGSVAWIRYRVWAADWHTRTLLHLSADGNFDRLVGVEMALDGALNGVSSAFDAATAFLVRTAEETLDIADRDRLPSHRYSWPNARRLLTTSHLGTDANGTANERVWRVVLDVDNALAGERDDVPVGWLANLRRLRNRVSHQDSLPRFHSSTSPPKLTAFDDRRGPAVDFLTRACDQIHDLTEAMVALAWTLGAHEAQTESNRPPWPQDE